MIEEKLKLARQRTAKGRIQLGIGLAAAICLCGLFVAGLSFFDFSQKNLPEKVSPQPIPAEKGKQDVLKKIQAPPPQIEELPPTRALLNSAAAARIENNLQKEYDFLQQVLGAEPAHQEVKARLEVLAGLIKSRNFDLQISSGFAAIEKQHAKEAKTHYQKAKTLDPQRPELSILMDRLLTLERSVRIEQAIRQAEQAIRQDDWHQAKIHFARAATDAPENKTVADGLKRADHFIELLTRFGLYFKNPYRLAHADVRKEAQTLLVQAEKVSHDSFEIKRQARKLSELIARINRLIPVTIISDNKTRVWVRSVGKVGVVSQKNIQLKPGHYTFEGARNGFKSKLVQAFIPYDQNEFSVRIICDDPI